LKAVEVDAGGDIINEAEKVGDAARGSINKI
jgi:hypothetical protein